MGRARRFVAEQLSDNMDDTTDVLLMTSELVANVISHARTDVTVTVRPGPPVRVEVHDGLAATETFRELLTAPQVMPAPSQETGRGVAIVRALADRVGLNDDADGGKVVWFEVDEPATPDDAETAWSSSPSTSAGPHHQAQGWRSHS